MSKKTEAPKLKALRSRECSHEELQAALVELIDLHNGLCAEIAGMMDRGQIKSKREAIWNKPYGL